MIVTVTMNPALDKTARVSRLIPGGLNRLEGITADPGGKGINVSRTIAALGGVSVATGFLAGMVGERIEHALLGGGGLADASPINPAIRDHGDHRGGGGSGSGSVLGVGSDHGRPEPRVSQGAGFTSGDVRGGIVPRFVWIEGQTRTNLKVLTEQFGITEFNEPGPTPTAGNLAELTSILAGLAAPGVIVVFSGSLPPGVNPTAYRDLAEVVKASGAEVFLDADGEPFRLGLAACPDVVKPNAEELGRCFGLDHIPGATECITLSRDLVADGIAVVMVSLGAGGALLVTRDTVVRAPGIPLRARSTVGAGDAMVAGLAHARDRGMDQVEAMRLAMAVSAGAVVTEGTNPPSQEVVAALMERVVIEDAGPP